VMWGDSPMSGMISVEYQFKGESAHAAGAPWRGRSALDAVELMDVGWNFRREHLRLQQRSHYVITNGGDQPNVVPQTAGVWYFFRELDYPHIKELWEIGDNMAKGAALMTNTEFTERVLGSAWPVHMNKAIAEDAYANIQQVGLPVWDDKDQVLAKAVQHEIKAKESGLATKIADLRGPQKEEERMGGGSDDIGDISWTVPTVTLNYPSNIPGLPGHNWSNAISMATPIAHKGNVAGAKVQALTLFDLMTRPQLVEQAWSYFKNVQTKTVHYQPLIRPEDKPAIWMNEKTMATYRDRMKALYYDPSKYDTYLEQLGIKYPTVR
jgi:aminobenzoyl-glutamate utilization protein B